eukprot:357877-Chlamydomonas_euryale.AAC.3
MAVCSAASGQRPWDCAEPVQWLQCDDTRTQQGNVSWRHMSCWDGLMLPASRRLARPTRRSTLDGVQRECGRIAPWLVLTRTATRTCTQFAGTLGSWGGCSSIRV